MNVVSHELNGMRVLEIQSEGIVIRSARDAADLTKQVLERGSRKLILYEKNLCPEMWQLSNGLALAILKEFADSSVDVALVGEFDRHKGKQVQMLIQESNLQNHAIFVDNVELAKTQLSKH
jgi:hypothetical protein